MNQGDEEFAALLDRARDGDHFALETILESWRSLIRLHAHGRLDRGMSARADTSDIVQETMTQAFREIQKFRGRTKGEWMSWLRSILLAQASRLRRHHSAAKRSVASEIEEIAEYATASTASPDGALLQNERLSQLTVALGSLPLPMYEVIFRRVFLQQPFAEVAQALDRSPEATRALWTRAIRKLKAQVEDGSRE